MTPNGQDGGIDSDSAVNEAAVAAFQATVTANRLNNELKELIARRIMASAGARIGDDGTDVMDKKTFGYLGVRKWKVRRVVIEQEKQDSEMDFITSLFHQIN